MKKKTNIICLIPAACFTLIFHCTTAPVERSRGYLCIEHKTHYYANRQDLCACLGINPTEYDSYQFFTIEDTTKKADDLPALTDRLKDEMERKIVSIVMRKIEDAMGKHIYKYWKFEDTNIPVTIRRFTKKDGEVYSAIVVAAMTKYSLSPRGIIMYLPLEYKMHILEKKKDE